MPIVRDRSDLADEMIVLFVVFALKADSWCRTKNLVAKYVRRRMKNQRFQYKQKCTNLFYLILNSCIEPIFAKNPE